MPIDYALYGSKETWDQISCRIRYGRADGKCEKCGATDKHPHPVYSKSKEGEKGEDKIVHLSCCHLDHDNSNHEDSNLIALCQWCHLDHDKKQHAAGRSFSRRYGRKLKEIQYGLFEEHEIVGKRKKRLKVVKSLE